MERGLDRGRGDLACTHGGFDCDGRRTKTLETLRYNATGGLVGQETPSYPSYSYVPPDTVIEATLMWACPTNN